jgi:hypothetical protein
MQRRAAAAYVAVFLLIAVGSYGVIATAQAPAISLADSEVDHEVTTGQSFAVGGTEYTVGGIESSGEGEDATTQATFEYEATVEQSETLENGSTVELDDRNWTVEVPAADDPSTFRLVENGTDDPETREFSEGDTYNGTKTVANVTADGATLTFETVETQEATVAEGGNVTLGDTTYTAHFPDGQTVQLTTDYAAYSEEEAAVEYHHERVGGLWVVSILGSVAGVGLLALAFLPNKGD